MTIEACKWLRKNLLTPDEYGIYLLRRGVKRVGGVLGKNELLGAIGGPYCQLPNGLLMIGSYRTYPNWVLPVPGPLQESNRFPCNPYWE
ncbi:hypothetical protein HAX54_038124, partial [Datura stramonium]|nr:hypothetical protein [Datura stramonium]